MYLGVRTLACPSGQSGWETPRMETEISLIEAHGLIVQPSHGAAGISTIVLLNLAASWLTGTCMATSAPPSVLQ